MKTIVLSFLTASGVFAVVDLFWLAYAGRKLYDKYISEFLARPNSLTGAVLFYVMYIAFSLYFVILPAINDGDVAGAFRRGALLGAFAYSTWELTNWAVIKGWPWQIVPIDIAWGTFLTSMVCGLTTLVALRFFA